MPNLKMSRVPAADPHAGRTRPLAFAASERVTWRIDRSSQFPRAVYHEACYRLKGRLRAGPKMKADDAISGLTVAILRCISPWRSHRLGRHPGSGFVKSIIGALSSRPLGGSPLSDGGPPGVIVCSATVNADGIDGLLIAMERGEEPTIRDL